MSDGNETCCCAGHQQPRCVHFRMGRCPDKSNVVEFARKLLNPGNGALEKMREYFGAEHNWPDHIPAMTEADYFLAWLWLEGFMVCPLPPADGGTAT